MIEPAEGDDRVGTELAGGRYRVIERIGTGSMGHVYRAYDSRLETDVVVKFPIADSALDRADMLERFSREVRSLVRLSHPHIVKIIDVGAHDGSPFVVLQYLSGGTLKDRLHAGPGGGPNPVAPESLRGWLPDVARALDFVHAQGQIHRDVKPANILFDAHGNAFLGDFGIIKALTPEPADAKVDNSLTAPGFLLGTPGYVAPEIVMGLAPDARSDQYALALTVHEALTGTNLMSGPSPSATIVNQTNVELPPLEDLVPRVTRRLSEAIRRALAKEPTARFPTCGAMVGEALVDLPDAPPPDAEPGLRDGLARCPGCGWPVSIDSPGSWAGPVRCQRCGASASIVLDPAGRPSLASRDGPASSNLGSQTFPAARPPSGRKTNWVGLIAVGLVLTSLAYFASQLFLSVPPEPDRHPAVSPPRARTAPPPAQGPVEPVVVNIVYGTEKRRWLQAALELFVATPAGKRSRINLIGKGSLEGARQILQGSGPSPAHVWSPASSAYKPLFLREWRVRHGGDPIARAQDLALTPMVFVFWKGRHDAFLKKYGQINFQTITAAMQEPGGWATIAGRADWGPFQFGMSDPNESNSGMLGLVLMASELAGKRKDLNLPDVLRPDFQAALRAYEAGLTRHGGTLTKSTGTLMEEMVKRGPAQYDGLLLYENLAIEFLDDAREHWGVEGELQVSYPDPNVWNDHPYYILDVPWSGPEERAAAAEFLDFLMSDPIQRLALREGFRPGNPSVPTRSEGSPLVANESSGVQIDIRFRLCEPPPAEVLQALLSAFQRLDR